MFKRSVITIAIIGMLSFAILFAGCTGTTTSPGSATTPVKSSGGPTKAPEQVVPVVVPGFTLVLKYDHEEPIFQDEEYLSEGLYKPDQNSTYEGSVAYLAIDVDKFVNSTAAGGIYDIINGTAVSSSGHAGKYNYDAETGTASIVLLQSDLIIASTAQAPDNVTAFDENLLRDASLKGMDAVISNL